MLRKKVVSGVLALSVILSSTPALALELEEKVENVDLFSIDEQGPEISVPMPEGIANLALNAKTLASSTRTSGTYTNESSNAVDNSINSRWMAERGNGNEKEWIIVDLGAAKDFNHLLLQFGASGGPDYAESFMYGNNFVVSASNTTTDVADMSTISDWQTLKSGQTEKSEKNGDFWFDEMKNARYLKLEISKQDPAGKERVFVWEFGAYNHSDEYLAEASLSEISKLPIPKYATKPFDIPLTTSFGADVTWTSNNEALEIDEKNKKVLVKPQATEVTCSLTATVKYKTQAPKNVTFTCIVSPTSQELIEYKIYPEPQSITRDGSSVEITKNVSVVIKNNNIDEITKQRAIEVFSKHGYTATIVGSDSASATESNVVLDVYSKEAYPDLADSPVAKDEGGEMGQENIFDAHVIKVSENTNSNKGDITIVGKHNDAIYYALASIDQMLDQAQASNTLSGVTIKDYSNSKYRGVIEGFYGYPYSVDDIKSLMEFGKKYKMNTFVYGPKADPYHASKWKDEYPTEANITEEQRKQGILTQENIKDIMKVSKETNVDFIWAIHPMISADNRIDITKPEAVEQGAKDVISKFEIMRGLGVTEFGMFVDDVDTGAVNVLDGAPAQAQLISKVAAGWKEKHPDEFKPIFYVPSLYCFSGFWPDNHVGTNIGPLADLDNINDIAVAFTGGQGLFSPIKNDAFFAYGKLIGGSKPTLWWNSPVNDAASNSLFMGPANQQYDMHNDVVDAWGMMSNPMNQAEASKVQLFGLLDYSWNISDFNAQKNWEASFAKIIDSDDTELVESFKIFSQNSAPAMHQDNTDKITVTYSGLDEAVRAVKDNPSVDDITVLQAKLKEWKDACLYLQENLPKSSNKSHNNLYGEIKPWLNKSIAIADILQSCMNIKAGKDTSLTTLYDAIYLDYTLTTSPDFAIGTMDSSGSSGSTMSSVGGQEVNEFIPIALGLARETLQASIPKITKAPELISNIVTDGINIDVDKSGITLSGLSGKTLKPGEYIGIALNSAPIIDGLSNIASSLPDGVELQCSTGGPIWNKYSADDELKSVTSIRLINMSAAVASFSADSLKVNTFGDLATSDITPPSPGYAGQSENYIVDGNFKTYYWTSQDPSDNTFEIKYNKTFNLKKLQIVFPASGDTLKAVTKVEASDDGIHWSPVATLNGTEQGAIQPEIITVDGESYNSYNINRINNISTKYLRLNFGTQGSWLKINEILTNSGVSPSVITNSDKALDGTILDGTFESLYDPSLDLSDSSITYNLYNPSNGIIDIYMKPNGSNLPKVEIKVGNDWQPAELQLKDNYNYYVDVNSIMNATELRLSWTDETRPIAIYEIMNNKKTTAEVDKSALAAAYGKAAKASSTNYSEAEWEQLKNAILKAMNIINGEATQEQVTEALNALNSAYKKEAVTIKTKNLIEKVNTTVKVPVIIENSYGFSDISITVNYDSKYMEPVSVVDGKVSTWSSDLTQAGKVIVSKSSTENIGSDGVLFYVEFNLKDLKGTTDITLTVNEFKFGGTENVDSNVQKATVTIKGADAHIYGDADGNEVLTANDAVNILDIVLSDNKDGIDQSIIEKLIVSGESELTANDASMVLKKVIDGNYVFPIERK